MTLLCFVNNYKQRIIVSIYEKGGCNYEHLNTFVWFLNSDLFRGGEHCPYKLFCIFAKMNCP